MELCFELRKLVLTQRKGLWCRPLVPMVTARSQDDQDLFPWRSGRHLPESCSSNWYEQGSSESSCYCSPETRTHFVILGLTGLLADQQLGFGHGSACKWKSFVQSHEPCPRVGCVWMRCLPSCTEEMGETRSFSCRRF